MQLGGPSCPTSVTLPKVLWHTCGPSMANQSVKYHWAKIRENHWAKIRECSSFNGDVQAHYSPLSNLGKGRRETVKTGGQREGDIPPHQPAI